jgi:hypothetical protein
MRVSIGSLLATGSILVSVACCLPLSRSTAQPPKPPGADKVPDLAPFLELGKYYVSPVEPKKDAKTGFVVGGKNDTTLILGLTEINSRTIAELEKDMRPGVESDVGSTAGFLGRDEKLLDVLAADNKFVVDERGLTHQELAKHLHSIGTIGRWQWRDHNKEVYKFVYHGRRFKVTTVVTKGLQPSPFRDGTESGTDVTVENLDTGKKLRYGLLVPYLIERYGFYEGKGTSYRVEPSKLLEVFDFLEGKAKKR